MRVDLARYRSVHRSIRWRSVALIVLGAMLFLFGAVWILLMATVLIAGRREIWDILYAPAFGIGLGLFPCLIGVGMVWWGSAGIAKLGRLREIATIARQLTAFSSQDVARGLGADLRRAESALLEAATEGILIDDPPPALSDPTTAPTEWSGAPPAPAPEAGLLTNRLLCGTYRVDTRLGSGGMGEVYAATHLRTGRRYAIKVLLPSACLSPDAIRRFEREASAAGAIGHPGIVAVHDFDRTEDGIWFLVMDLLEGETLEQRLSRVGTLPFARAKQIALDLCEALAAAHDRGLLHRDLKPANVFLVGSATGEERAVLLDFGLVKPIEDAARSRITVTGTALGTPMYMSPEQARGEPVGVESDVYGLGAVLYEMLTGAPPFLDQTLAQVYARLLTESAARASSLATQPLPPAVDDVLARALEKDPRERFSSIRELRTALGAIPARVVTLVESA